MNNDLISRKALLERIKEDAPWWWQNFHSYLIVDMLKEAPASKPNPCGMERGCMWDMASRTLGTALSVASWWQNSISIARAAAQRWMEEKTMRKLAEYYGVRVDELFEGE